MKQDNKIDEIFRQQLGTGSQGSFPIPESFLVDIERKLDELEEKKKKGGLWVWLLPAFILFMTTAYSIEIFTHWQEEVITTSMVSQHEKKSFKINYTETGSSHSPTEAITHTAQQTFITETRYQTPVSNTRSQSTSPQNTTTTNHINVPEYITAKNPEQQQPATMPGGLTMTETDQAVNEQILATLNPSVGLADSIPELSADSLSNPYNEIEGPGFFIGLNSGMLNFFKKSEYVKTKLGFFIDLTAGAHYVWKNFQHASGAYNVKRETEEKNILAYDMELLAGMRYKNFFVQTGATYTKWGENINYTNTTSTTYEWQYSIDSTGDTTAVLVPQVISNDYIDDNNGKNTYKYINIPLLIGYEWKKEKFTLASKLGGTVGFTRNPGPQWVAIDNTASPPSGLRSRVQRNNGMYITRDTYALTEEYAQRVLFNMYIGADAKYSLGNFGIMLSASYKRNINELIKSLETKNRYMGLGLRAGVSYNF